MIRFNSDYTEGCHPAILERLAETNMEQTAGYGADEYCAQAAEKIREACGAPKLTLSAAFLTVSAPYLIKDVISLVGEYAVARGIKIRL